MAAQEEPDIVREARRKNYLFVKNAPKFDLDAYIANYKGRTRIDRLFLIGTSSSFLSAEALKAALAEAKKGKDVTLYEKIVDALHDIIPNDPDSIPDVAWVDRMNKQIKAETTRLEQELKGYKNNLIKESIRMGYDDLGKHYHDIGDLPNATKAYSKMREYCTLSSHIATMSFHIINVSVDGGAWLPVQSSVMKIRSLGPKPGDPEHGSAKLSSAMGLAQLASRNYKEAAISFLACDPRMVQARLDNPDDEEAYNEILTPNDIAVYGGLCALASMNRSELQTKVLENTQFRNYLELEPHIRRAISFFVSSKYSSCLSILESYEPDYFLDLHLQRHVAELYSRIRTKSIVQYFIPFSCVSLKALASAFHTDEVNIQHELVDMIKKGSLDACIDLEHRVLLANHVDQRLRVHEEALKSAEEYVRTANTKMLRLQAIDAGLEVKGQKPPKSQFVNFASNVGSSISGIAGDIFMGMDKKGKGSLRSGGNYS